jgi:two-component SAPR family response regulator
MTNYLFRYCLLAIILVLISGNTFADNIPERSSGSVFTKEKISISLDVSFTDDISDYPLTIFEISRSKGQVVTLIADYYADDKLVFFLTGKGTLRRIITDDSVMPAHSMKINATITSSSDLLELSIADTTIMLEGQGFRNGDRYIISVLKETGDKTVKQNGGVVVHSANVSERSAERMNYTEILLLLLLVVADIIFFIIIHLRNKYFRKRNNKDQALSIMIKNEKIADSLQLKISSVYLFGGFEIYNKNGEEISSSFSPLLKELFLILLCKQPDEGITSSSLKEILWFDKNEDSARNNRSVYFAKLRQILDTLGLYQLTNRSGKWVIDFEDIYVDFLEYSKIIRNETINENDITKLVSIIRKGSLLPECNYSWLDEVKAGIADYTITILSDYSDQLDKKLYPELLNSIADALFTVDPLNDLALSFKCRYYNGLGKSFLSKQLYSNYVKEYRSLYGEEYKKSYMDVISEEK